ncbi:MAG: quinone-dependent dihydroorotate dehydrogenase [Gemmatimonadaceae bacterium]|nr:quinone-dependent dihydroorotate dehydrogenase [Gemmatimonadaceae bacterium]
MTPYHLLRPLLFRFDAERAHGAALAAASAVGAVALGRAALRSIYGFEDERLATEVAGLRFPNPLGLAAGLDKNGRAVQALSCLGPGHVEIGSVSARPSRGNPRPRLFRLPADEAIVVNYGVPNDGADAVARRVSARPVPVPLGVNLVETNSGRPAPADEVIAELAEAARAFAGTADYLTLNLNCPNTTAGASPFDDPAAVAALLAELAAVDGLPPVFLKITARTDPPFIEAFLEAVDPFPRVAGFVFNLPPGKEYALRTPAAVVDPLPGTLCGPPARGLLDETVRAWYGRIDRRRHRIIGSGGIASAGDAWRKIRLGASLLQLYTGLVYHGPGLVRRINRGLVRLLEADGLAHVGEAVGLDSASSRGRRTRSSGAPRSARPLAPARR